MLNLNALSQLKSLKQEIHSSIPRHEGKVRATGGRYGFVNTDDNQQFFLNPDEMDKLLAGDVIAFKVEETKEGKSQAIIEKLISSTQDEFVGQYIVKGKGHFISPDHPTFNRWVFVPPAQRNSAKDGDLVNCKISQHPYPSGKVQAQVLEVIGQTSDRQIESSMMVRKWDIAGEFSEDCQNEAQALLSVMDQATSAEPRTDLTAATWLTIDSAMSRDLDDALCCQKTDSGWSLQVAIADPSCAIKPGSDLDKEALRRSTSSYFIDNMIPMLPGTLSEGAFSLLPNQVRPALVCHLTISEQGDITDYRLEAALIESKAKLSYTQVAAFLDDSASTDEQLTETIKPVLTALNFCALALNGSRRKNNLVLDDRIEYKAYLNDQGKVDQIVSTERNIAHKLVEECMVAVNRSVANFLAQKEHGLFIQHAGIRSERQGEARALVKEQLNVANPEKISTLEGFVEIQQIIAAGNPEAEDKKFELPLQAILARQLERSKFGTEAKPHVGMGLSAYTTFTSPIRKYNDLLVHRLVKSYLFDSKMDVISDDVLAQLGKAQNNSRMAAWQADQWLKAEWLKRQFTLEKEANNVSKEGLKRDGQIVQVNSGGFTVRLDGCGIEGQVDVRRNKEWKFDTKTMTHKHVEKTYRLEQPVVVTIANITPVLREVKFNLCAVED
ncbi:MAG: VacB/RNase II family 3'-5' exoribonuclease [Oleispira sp.]